MRVLGNKLVTMRVGGSASRPPPDLPHRVVEVQGEKDFRRLGNLGRRESTKEAAFGIMRSLTLALFLAERTTLQRK